jgi:hypothetical protein
MDQVHSLVFTADLAAFTDSTTLSTFALSVLLDNACTALVSHRPPFVRIPYRSIFASFYCIVLLTALFISSCYWQPLPIDTPLSTPWSANIKTFSEALNTYLPDYEYDRGPDDDNNGNHKRPTVIRLMDRCWCDFSSGSLFEPFNVSRWELASVTKFKKELLERGREKEKKREVKEDGGELEEDSESTVFAAPTPPPTPRPSATTSLETEKKGAFEAFRSSFWRAPSGTSEFPDPPSPFPTDTETALPEERRPVAPGEIDLEAYGFDLVLDFKWTRRPS